nr:MAG TPA: hypothetical protein [Caudoviricetes sp.]
MYNLIVKFSRIINSIFYYICAYFIVIQMVML